MLCYVYDAWSYSSMILWLPIRVLSEWVYDVCDAGTQCWNPTRLWGGDLAMYVRRMGTMPHVVGVALCRVLAFDVHYA